MEQRELIFVLLPPELIEHFDLVSIEQKPDGYHLYLDQKNLLPLEVKDHKLESKGFLYDVVILAFPLRGKASILDLRRRK